MICINTSLARVLAPKRNRSAVSRWSLRRVCYAALLLYARTLFLALFCFFLPDKSVAADVSYWIWNRSSALTAAEQSALQVQGVRELYWRVGELENRTGEWRWRHAPFRPPPSPFQIVPVIRLDPQVREPFTGRALEDLLARLREAITANELTELQIDCDTPDRLLGPYAHALARIRQLGPRLTVTALAGWSRSAAWPDLQSAVEEIFPMFYDLEPDPPNVGHGAMPRPLIDLPEFEAQLREWNACRIPWRAGLPNFARVTVYDRAGKSRGHIRKWNWQDIVFNRALVEAGATDPSTVLLRASAATRIAGTELAEGEFLSARFPDRTALAQAIKSAEKMKVRGVIYFRLPDTTDPSGWSLRQLAMLDSNEDPRLTLRRISDQTFRLTNETAIDLPPRLTGAAGERDRGYQLEVDAAAPIWREALAGDFWRVAGHIDPETNPVAVSLPLATRLTFWFSHLPAAEQLTTGLIQTAPGFDAGAIRYRVVNVPGLSEWRKIE